MQWIRGVQNRDQWRAVVKMVMDSLESIKRGNFPQQHRDRGMTLRHRVCYLVHQVLITGNVTQCRRKGFK